MYWILPLSTPELVSLPTRDRAFAIPKSMSFAIPLVLTRMLWGLTSRWTISRARAPSCSSCASCSPEQVSASTRITTPVGTFMPLRWHARFSFDSASPSTYSMTR